MFDVRAAGRHVAARLLAFAALAKLPEQIGESAAPAAEQILQVDVGIGPAAPAAGPRIGSLAPEPTDS